MSRLLCLALMLFGLGACSDANTPTTAPILVSNSCGDIAVSGTPPRSNDANAARQAANCFAQAFQACRAITLTVRETDSNVTRQFSIVSSGSSCTLRHALQTDANSPPAVADCASARLENNALVIASCSHLGDFILTP
jgi:hypothetical protein